MQIPGFSYFSLFFHRELVVGHSDLSSISYRPSWKEMNRQSLQGCSGSFHFTFGQ